MKNYFYIFILIVLINSGGGIYFEMYRNSLTIFLFLLLVIYLFIHKKVYFLKAYIIIFLLFVVALFINYQFAINGQTINPYGYFLLSLLIAILVTTTINKNTFIANFVRALNFYKYHAILTFFAFFIVKNSLFYFEYSDNKGYHTFYYAFFYLLETSTRDFFSITYVRNNGLFWEPGILQIYMNILLYLQLFVIKSTRYQKSSTIFVILTTFSTTGYIVLSLLLSVKYLSTLTFSKFIKTFPFAVAFVLLFFPLLTENIEEKTSGSKAMSAQVRLFDTLQSIKIIYDYPFSGIGLTTEAYSKLQQSYKKIFDMYSPNPEGNTNSILQVIVSFGIPIGIFIIYSLYKQNIFQNKKNLLFFILLISLSTEPLLLRPFFLFIILNGMLYSFLTFFKIPLENTKKTTFKFRMGT